MSADEIKAFRERLGSAWAQRRAAEDAVREGFRPELEALGTFMADMLTAIGVSTREELQGTSHAIDFTTLPKRIDYRYDIDQKTKRTRDFYQFSVILSIEERMIRYEGLLFRRDDLSSLFSEVINKAEQHFRPKSATRERNPGWAVDDGDGF